MTFPLPEVDLQEQRSLYMNGHVSVDEFNIVEASLYFYLRQVTLIRELGRTRIWEYPGSHNVTSDLQSFPIDPNKQLLGEFDRATEEIGGRYQGIYENQNLQEEFEKNYRIMVSSYLKLVGELIRFEANKNPRETI